MKKAYFVAEDEKLRNILRATYHDVFAALLRRKPGAKELIEDEELFQLHDLLGLLRLGQLRVTRVLGEKEENFLVLEIGDSN